MAGKMDPDDIRNTLILKVIEAIKKLDPDYAIVENVVQMLKTGIIFEGEPIKILDLIHQELGDKYNIKSQVMDAADFETPQYRKRAIILLSKKEFKEWKLPKKHPHITVREVIGDLPSLEAGQKSAIPLHEGKKHNNNHILWMKHTPTGETAHHNEVNYPQKDGRPIKGFMSTYKRMGWDRPAPTVTMANGSISSQNNVHPGTLQNDGTYSDARVLSILEIMRISGIPTNWAIPSWASENLIRHVVGEMVPPKLIYHIVKNMPKAKK